MVGNGSNGKVWARLGEAEAALEAQKDFTDQLLATVQAAVVMLDEHGHIVYINAFMERLSGYRLAEVMGKDWGTAFLPGRGPRPARALFPTAVGGIQTETNIHTIVTKAGEERSVQWVLLPAWTRNEHWLLVSGVDITDREHPGL